MYIAHVMQHQRGISVNIFAKRQRNRLQRLSGVAAINSICAVNMAWRNNNQQHMEAASVAIMASVYNDIERTPTTYNEISHGAVADGNNRRKKRISAP